MKKETTPKKKNPREIKGWAVVDDNHLVSDGSGHIAVYFDRKGATEWRKDMLGKEGKVLPVLIKIID